jgi:3',5'-nucleoside bisphosphate phosphatase
MKSSKFAGEVKGQSTSKEFVDLHMHSTFSDGALQVKDLIDLCRSQGLTAISITDHDNIDSYEEGKEYARAAGIEYIPGVEISSSVDGSDIHILGYLFDPTHLKLNKTLVELRARRVDRARKIVDRLEEKGVSLNYDKVVARAQGGSVGRAHIAAQLMEEEFVATFQDAFTKYLGNESELMTDLDTIKLSPEEAIGLIREAGGVPVMAHPSKTNRDDLLENLVEWGLMGIETYCHGQTNATQQRYKAFALKHNLVCTGGADFHVKRYDGRNSPGSLRIPYSVLTSMKEVKGSQAA